MNQKEEMFVSLKVLGIQIRIRFRMFLGLPDPDPFVRDIRILPFSHKGVERLKDWIWIQDKILTKNFSKN
jgi:hypothetical protein